LQEYLLEYRISRYHFGEGRRVLQDQFGGIKVADRHLQQEPNPGPWQRCMDGIILHSDIANLFEVFNPPDNLREKVPRKNLFPVLPPERYSTLLASLDLLLG
jgi:hypothetical protein